MHMHKYTRSGAGRKLTARQPLPASPSPTQKSAWAESSELFPGRDERAAGGAWSPGPSCRTPQRAAVRVRTSSRSQRRDGKRKTNWHSTRTNTCVLCAACLFTQQSCFLHLEVRRESPERHAVKGKTNPRQILSWSEERRWRAGRSRTCFCTSGFCPVLLTN